MAWLIGEVADRGLAVGMTVNVSSICNNPGLPIGECPGGGRRRPQCLDVSPHAPSLLTWSESARSELRSRAADDGVSPCPGLLLPNHVAFLTHEAVTNS